MEIAEFFLPGSPVKLGLCGWNFAEPYSYPQAGKGGNSSQQYLSFYLRGISGAKWGRLNVCAFFFFLKLIFLFLRSSSSGNNATGKNYG